MKRRARPALIGAFVLGAVVLSVVAVLNFGSGEFFQEKIPCATYFEEDVNRLSIGAPVKFKGVEVGTVRGIEFPLDVKLDDSLIIVSYELFASRMRGPVNGSTTEERIANAVREGLHARLSTESLLTGLLYVNLEIQPEGPRRRYGTSAEVIEIPSLPSRRYEVAEFAESAMERFSQMPVEDMIAAIRDAARSVDELVRSPALVRTVEAADRTMATAERTFESAGELSESLLAEMDALTTKLNGALEAATASLARLESALATGERTMDEVGSGVRASVEELTASLKTTSDTMRSTSTQLSTTLATVEAVLDPRAPLVESLRQTLEQLGRAAGELGRLADDLRRDPGVLLRGRELKGSR